MDIVIGYQGKDHVTAGQLRRLVSGLSGDGAYVLETQNKLAATMQTANQVRIDTGDIVAEGAYATVEVPETLVVENGVTGQKRNDLVVARYSKDGSTSVESMELAVVKGTSVSFGDPVDPEIESGSILAGDSPVEFPLWRIPINGLAPGAPVQLIETIPSIDALRDSVSQLPDVQAGVKYSIDVASGTYTDVPVIFERSFSSTPMCFCCLRTASLYSSYGSINPVPISASAEGFTIRLYNDSDRGAVPSINWVAIL